MLISQRAFCTLLPGLCPANSTFFLPSLANSFYRFDETIVRTGLLLLRVNPAEYLVQLRKPLLQISVSPLFRVKEVLIHVFVPPLRKVLLLP